MTHLSDGRQKFEDFFEKVGHPKTHDSVIVDWCFRPRPYPDIFLGDIYDWFTVLPLIVDRVGNVVQCVDISGHLFFKRTTRGTDILCLILLSLLAFLVILCQDGFLQL